MRSAELHRRSKERGLEQRFTDIGIKALAAVVDGRVEQDKATKGLVFLRNVYLNDNFDLIDERSIEQHYRRMGIDSI